MATKILISGGAGFIGSHFVEFFAKQGFSVEVLDNFSTGHNVYEADNVKYVSGDITDLSTYELEVPDYAIHLAAAISVVESMTHPDKYEFNNVHGSRVFFQWCADKGVKAVVSASSAAVYGDCGKDPIHETFKYGGISPYAKSKYDMEELPAEIDRKNTKFIFCRFFNVYGPRQDPHSPYTGVMSVFLQRAKDGAILTVNGDGEETRDFVFVDDLVKGAWALLEKGIEGAYNIGTGKTVTINALAEICCQFNEESSITHGPPRDGDIKFSESCPDKIFQTVGWKAETPFEEGINETWVWFSGKLNDNFIEQK